MLGDAAGQRQKQTPILTPGEPGALAPGELEQEQNKEQAPTHNTASRRRQLAEKVNRQVFLRLSPG